MVKNGPLKQAPLRHRRSRNQIAKMKERLNRKFNKNSFNGLYWDRKKTKSDNLARLGLASDPNEAPEVVRERVENIPEEERAQIPVGVEMPSIWNYVVEPQERMNIEKMLEKHGRDFKKMAMDIKLNIYQYTPKQLEKRITKYDKYMEILAKIEEQKVTKKAKEEEDSVIVESKTKPDEEEDEEAKEQKEYQQARLLGRRPGRFIEKNGKFANRVGEKTKKQIRWF